MLTQPSRESTLPLPRALQICHILLREPSVTINLQVDEE